MPTLKTEPQQTDIVSEARALAEYVDGLAAGLQDVKLGRASTVLRQLADEVERLREQWNTRFNTLCGLCGKRYLGPRDEHLHGFGKCDRKVNDA